ncbi:unnamed protein product [Vitrella brassicaformis CCMP3155]|uniref:Uncharacterized protein n=3 Tax=Vitrella brassicaformis TaxID=1169539 RepID=A0A0G4GDN8_VITBC|nr:unnamed protein product [Vitrella brassicaformis CCMP3155]|eukprot:CEM27528.1 unnamed protein product [Vitrella brassicaformis CCMP3155]
MTTHESSSGGRAPAAPAGSVSPDPPTEASTTHPDPPTGADRTPVTSHEADQPPKISAGSRRGKMRPEDMIQLLEASLRDAGGAAGGGRGGEGNGNGEGEGGQSPETVVALDDQPDRPEERKQPQANHAQPGRRYDEQEGENDVEYGVQELLVRHILSLAEEKKQQQSHVKDVSKNLRAENQTLRSEVSALRRDLLDLRSELSSIKQHLRVNPTLPLPFPLPSPLQAQSQPQHNAQLFNAPGAPPAAGPAPGDRGGIEPPAGAGGGGGGVGIGGAMQAGMPLVKEARSMSNDEYGFSQPSNGGSGHPFGQPSFAPGLAGLIDASSGPSTTASASGSGDATSTGSFTGQPVAPRQAARMPGDFSSSSSANGDIQITFDTTGPAGPGGLPLPMQMGGVAPWRGGFFQLHRTPGAVMAAGPGGRIRAKSDDLKPLRHMAVGIAEEGQQPVGGGVGGGMNIPPMPAPAAARAPVAPPPEAPGMGSASAASASAARALASAAGQKNVEDMLHGSRPLLLVDPTYQPDVSAELADPNILQRIEWRINKISQLPPRISATECLVSPPFLTTCGLGEVRLQLTINPVGPTPSGPNYPHLPGGDGNPAIAPANASMSDVEKFRCGIFFTTPTPTTVRFCLQMGNTKRGPRLHNFFETPWDGFTDFCALGDEINRQEDSLTLAAEVLEVTLPPQFAAPGPGGKDRPRSWSSHVVGGMGGGGLLPSQREGDRGGPQPHGHHGMPQQHPPGGGGSGGYPPPIPPQHQQKGGYHGHHGHPGGQQQQQQQPPPPPPGIGAPPGFGQQAQQGASEPQTSPRPPLPKPPPGPSAPSGGNRMYLDVMPPQHPPGGGPRRAMGPPPGLGGPPQGRSMQRPMGMQTPPPGLEESPHGGPVNEPDWINSLLGEDTRMQQHHLQLQHGGGDPQGFPGGGGFFGGPRGLGINHRNPPREGGLEVMGGRRERSLSVGIPGTPASPLEGMKTYGYYDGEAPPPFPHMGGGGGGMGGMPVPQPPQHAPPQPINAITAEEVEKLQRYRNDATSILNMMASDESLNNALGNFKQLKIPVPYQKVILSELMVQGCRFPESKDRLAAFRLALALCQNRIFQPHTLDEGLQLFVTDGMDVLESGRGGVGALRGLNPILMNELLPVLREDESCILSAAQLDGVANLFTKRTS